VYEEDEMLKVVTIRDSECAYSLDNCDFTFEEGIEMPYTSDLEALFIKGGKSDYILDEDYEMIKKKFPSAQFVTIENASHWVHADAPDELCKSLSAFLEKQCDYSK